MRKKKTLKSLIAVMLILVLAASVYIVHRSMSIRAAKEKAAAEAQAAEEAQRQAEEAAAKEAEKAEQEANEQKQAQILKKGG